MYAVINWIIRRAGGGLTMCSRQLIGKMKGRTFSHRTQTSMGILSPNNARVTNDDGK